MAVAFKQAETIMKQNPHQKSHAVWLKTTCASALLVAMVTLVTGCERFQSADTQIEKASAEIEKKELAAAVIHLKNALQKQPENARARFMLGKAYLLRGEMQNAVKELKRAQELKFDANLVLPLLARALLLSGNLADLGNLDAQQATDVKTRAEVIGLQGDGLLAARKGKEAQLLYNQALKLNPDSIAAQFGLARLAAINGAFSEADALAEGILKRAPRNVEAMLFRSELQKARGNRAEAIAFAQKALEIDAADARVPMALGLLYLENNQLDEALKQAEALKKNSPGLPSGFYLSALVQSQKKELRTAQEEVQKALKLAPNYPPALLLAATIEMSLGSAAQAEQYVKTALGVTPDNPTAIRLMAMIHLSASRPADALELLKPLVEKYPESADLNGLIGEAYFQNGDMEQASKYFAQAAKTDRSAGRALTGLAMTEVASGNLDHAVIALENALKHQGTAIQADLMLIGARIKQGQVEKANQAIDVLEKKLPNSSVPLQLRATLALSKGDTAKAYAFLDEAFKRDPKDFAVVRFQVKLDQRAGKLQEAQKRIEEFNKRNDKHPEALLALAEIRTLANAPVDEVIALVKRAQAADPKKTQATEVLTRLLIVHGRANEAQEVLQQGLAKNPDLPALVDLMGSVQMNLNHPADAVASYTRLTTVQPRNEAAWSKLAQAQFAAGEKNSALTSINRALALAPKNLELQEIALKMRIANKNYPEALTLAREVQKNQPKSPIGFAFEGDVLFAQKQYAEAVTRYEQALKIQPNASFFLPKIKALNLAQRGAEADKALTEWLRQYPKDVPARVYAAEIALQNKKIDTAIAFYKEVLVIQPDNVTVLNNLAWASSEKNDPAALQYIEHALRLQPNQATFLDTRGMILAKQGKYDSALNDMKRATQLMPNQAIFHLNYARTLLKSGKKSDAKQELEILRRLGTSDNPEVQALAQELG